MTSAALSVGAALRVGLGLFSGKAADRFGPRPLLLVAAAGVAAPLPPAWPR